MTVQETARHFRVDQVTIRRWIGKGCPYVRKGTKGPGKAAILNLQQVEQWRGRSPGPVGLSGDAVAQQIANALLDALDKDHADIRAGVSRDDAAAMLVAAWERICKTMGKSYAFDQQPEAIRTLMSLL